MARAERDPLARGAQAGIKRVERYGMKVEFESLGRGLTATQELLAQRGLEVNPRFLELFSELVVVAVSSRLAYGEEPLTESDIAQYLEHSMTFLNSFRHV